MTKSKSQITIEPIRFKIFIETEETDQSFELSLPMIRELRRAAAGQHWSSAPVTQILLQRGLIAAVPEKIQSTTRIDCPPRGCRLHTQISSTEYFYCDEFSVTERGLDMIQALDRFEQKVK